MKIVIFRLFCVLFFVCFLPAGIFAESDKDLNSTEKEKTKLILTVDEAVKRALETHVDIQQSAIKLEQSKRECSHSWNKVLPSVSVTGSVSEKQGWKDLESDTVSASVGGSASLSLNTYTKTAQIQKKIINSISIMCVMRTKLS